MFLYWGDIFKSGEKMGEFSSSEPQHMGNLKEFTIT